VVGSDGFGYTKDDSYSSESVVHFMLLCYQNSDKILHVVSVPKRARDQVPRQKGQSMAKRVRENTMPRSMVYLRRPRGVDLGGLMLDSEKS
jgi:hypothetical protein